MLYDQQVKTRNVQQKSNSQIREQQTKCNNKEKFKVMCNSRLKLHSLYYTTIYYIEDDKTCDKVSHSFPLFSKFLLMVLFNEWKFTNYSYESNLIIDKHIKAAKDKEKNETRFCL